jgi:lysyl-tRNA synthetase class 1
MFWLDRVFDEAQDALKDKIASGEVLTIRDEKTASGQVHVGSMRALALHGALKDRFDEAGIPSVFKYEINDYDHMDGLPVYLDEETYRPYMGKSLYSIPAPDGVSKNFAENYAKEYIGVIEETGYHPEFYRASELYLSGRMNDPIRIALERAAAIRAIYKEVSGSVKPDSWYPLMVICENCGRLGTTKVTGFDGELVTYTCEPDAVKWARGCGHSGRMSPFDGKGKFPWKVDWAAKWKVVGVDIEGGGKDHYTKGGARDVAERISREVFEYEPPFGVANEFFLVGGKKMSSSKGAGSSAREVANLVPPHIFRLALLGKDINKQVNFDPTGDTIPLLFDQYDSIAADYWEGTYPDNARLFTFIHPKEERELLEKRYLPRFGVMAYLIQMPHLSLETEVERMKGEPLTSADIVELNLRKEYAKRWLEVADEQYRFTLATDRMPEAGKDLTDGQKAALATVLAYVVANDPLDGLELHTALHEIRKASGILPIEFFSALYGIFLGKGSGPKAGWFLSVLDRDFLIARLTEAVS